MRRAKCTVLGVLLIGFLLPQPLLAQHPIDNNPSPLWTSDETLLTASLLTGTVALYLVDDEIRDDFQKNRSGGLDTLADGMDVLGHPLTLLGVGGGIWSYGRWQGDNSRADTGKMAFTAILAAEAVTLGIKAASGRHRPDDAEDATSFRPFAFGHDRDSLPSGHAAAAFALASVLSRRSEKNWVPWVCYGAAGLVGISRVYRDDHWASDVVLGALVGELSGRLVLHWNTRKDFVAGITPLPGGGMVRLSMGW